MVPSRFRAIAPLEPGHTSHRRRRHTTARPSAHGPGSERWLVSYADFITVLFAFFVMMYALSTVDVKKFRAMVGSLQGAFGSEQSAPSTGGDEVPPTPGPGAGAEADLAETERWLREILAADVASGLLDLRLDRRGLVISIQEAGSFETGSADLSPVTSGLLDKIAGALAQVQNLVRVEGHTDDVPIHTARFASNWELSTARATNVVAYLAQQARLMPARLSAAGYAEFHPRVANDSEALRARNRRVDIIVLNPATEAAEEPPGARPLP